MFDEYTCFMRWGEDARLSWMIPSDFVVHPTFKGLG
jgi:hypothetical protein